MLRAVTRNLQFGFLSNLGLARSARYNGAHPSDQRPERSRSRSPTRIVFGEGGPSLYAREDKRRRPSTRHHGRKGVVSRGGTISEGVAGAASAWSVQVDRFVRITSRRRISQMLPPPMSLPRRFSTAIRSISNGALGSCLILSAWTRARGFDSDSPKARCIRATPHCACCCPERARVHGCRPTPAPSPTVPEQSARAIPDGTQPSRSRRRGPPPIRRRLGRISNSRHSARLAIDG